MVGDVDSTPVDPRQGAIGRVPAHACPKASTRCRSQILRVGPSVDEQSGKTVFIAYDANRRSNFGSMPARRATRRRRACAHAVPAS
jgi:hypothetical protein